MIFFNDEVTGSDGDGIQGSYGFLGAVWLAFSDCKIYGAIWVWMGLQHYARILEFWAWHLIVLFLDASVYILMISF